MQQVKTKMIQNTNKTKEQHIQTIDKHIT